MDKILLGTVDIIYLIYDIIYFHITPYFLFMILPIWKLVLDYDPKYNASNAYESTEEYHFKEREM